MSGARYYNFSRKHIKCLCMTLSKFTVRIATDTLEFFDFFTDCRLTALSEYPASWLFGIAETLRWIIERSLVDCLRNWLSERWPDNLDRSDTTFPSVDRLELLSLSSVTDWTNVSKCVASGATIAFILLSISLDDDFSSSNRHCTLSSTSLADFVKTCDLPISTNCRVGVLFPSDIVNF